MRSTLIALGTTFLLVGCKVVNAGAERTLAQFSATNQQCYDRAKQPHTMVVDAHHHFKPFNGDAIPYEELIDYAKRSGVLFVNVYGIGQVYQRKPDCDGNKNCLSQLIAPTLENDLKNVKDYLDSQQQQVVVTLSMTFPDLNQPEQIVPTMNALAKQFGSVFKWMGEVNLVKQALFDNGRQPVASATIAKFKPFMEKLRENATPLAIHADLGSDASPLRYLPLFESLLTQYPNNVIVWMHMGLSKELANIDAKLHIQTVETLLEKHPKLMLDLSWRILADNHFSDRESKQLYVDFINRYPERFLSGTDFVAYRSYNFFDYKREVAVNSDIFKHLDNSAFRNIALGQNYFDLLRLPYVAPIICEN